MDVDRTIPEVRGRVARWRKEGHRVGFVPTMGALHEGHLSLFRLAAERCDRVVASVYVNPEQFAPDEDFESYPRDLEGDLAKAGENGVDAVFAPDDEVMYGDRKNLRIEIDELNEHMDGGSRPGFFEGILLVVNKLFNIVRPDLAVFGQKDIQQFRILQRMVTEFHHPVELVMGPIVRANDGLALSSRNAYLDDGQREVAPSLYRSLRWLKGQIEEGARNLELLMGHQKSELEAKGFEIDYLNLFDYASMQPVDTPKKGEKYILAGAVYLGKTRLIDNMILELDS
ncbi:MAG: pantoate--beta-alanine ligase [Balneolaceae bacterium]|nr:pantoate--beta-alanine ligase [Balneolaceae bacterium]